MKIPVSVVISAYNVEDKIGDCLKSVEWADEVIVIDNESTDKTGTIAKDYGAVVYKKKNNLMLNVNKNFGFSKAKHEWILSLDSDERVTPELAEEIRQIVEQKEHVKNGFSVPRKNIMFGKTIMHTGWYPDYQLRLFKKNYGKFAERHVHEQLTLSGESDFLKYPIIHLHYETIAQFLHKTFTIYAPNEADEKIRNGYVLKFEDSIRLPFNEFLSRFFAREGYKDGFHGLMLSLFMACYHLVVFALIWEKEKFKESTYPSITEFEKEINRNSKDFQFWIVTEKLKQTKNPLKAGYIKMKRKLF